jgi:type VI secretion system FHA domain protein
MAIKLRVISDHYRELGEHRSRVFGVNGGTIGRATDNDWILPDPKRIVSGHHCSVEYRGGVYWLRDSSTNGVYVNDSKDPASASGAVALKDGDRLRIGEYEIVVSLDDRVDFLSKNEEQPAPFEHLDDDLGSPLNIDGLLGTSDPGESGSVPVGNAYGLKVRGLLSERARRETGQRVPDEPPPPPASAPPDWATRTRPVTRQELDEAIERRRSRQEPRPRPVPLHQQSSTWTDLHSAVQAFCRGAGVDPDSLSAEARAVLPLLAGQLLRELAVGLADIRQGRDPVFGDGPGSSRTVSGNNPLAGSTSIEQALQRLFESHGRIYGGAVESLRESLQEIKEHERASQRAMTEGLRALMRQMDPANVADQFDQGRARTRPSGEDLRPQYWEHYVNFHRLLSQGLEEGLPQPVLEAFQKAYRSAREQSRGRGGPANGETGD